MPVRYVINILSIIFFLVLGNFLLKIGLFGRAQVSTIIQSGIYIILAVSLNIVVGYLGHIPLGQAGFMAIGGYAAAFFWKSGILGGELAFIIGIIIAGISSGLFGFLISMPAFRLNGDYFAIITLAFSEIIRSVLINFPKVTGGAQGLKRIPKYSNFFCVYSIVIIVCTLIHLIMKSKHGRAILSTREDEIASKSCGVNIRRYKIFAFTISAFFTGIAGAVYATNQGIIAPSEYGFMKSVDVLVMVVLGGMGSMIGSITAAAFLASLPLFLQSVMKSFNNYRMIVYSFILIIIMVFKPSGLFGNYDFSFSAILERIINRLFVSKNEKVHENL
jgi:branched-chain amino acid transport system permease protein